MFKIKHEEITYRKGPNYDILQLINKRKSFAILKFEMHFGGYSAKP